MRATLVASHEPAGKVWQLCKVLYVFELKKQYILIHAQFTRIVIFRHIGNVTPNEFVKSNLLQYRHVLYSSNICEILLYNRQWVVITLDLICGVRAAHR